MAIKKQTYNNTGQETSSATFNFNQSAVAADLLDDRLFLLRKMMHVPYLTNYSYHMHGQSGTGGANAHGVCSQILGTLSSGSPTDSGITHASTRPIGYNLQTNYQQILANASQMSQQTKPYAKSFMIDSILGLTSQHRPYDLSIARDRQSRIIRIATHDRENSNIGSRKLCEQTGECLLCCFRLSVLFLYTAPPQPCMEF